MRRARAILMFVILIGGSRAASQVMQFDGQVTVRDLVDLAAEQLGLSLEYAPSIFGQQRAGGTVSLRLSRDLSAEELWRLAEVLLAERGLTIVRRPGTDVLSVVSVAAAMPAMPSDQEDARSGIVEVVYTPSRLSAEELSQFFGKLVLSTDQARLDRLPGSSTLLIRGLRHRVEAVVERFEIAEGRAADRQIERIELVHIRREDAERVLAAVNEARASSRQSLLDAKLLMSSTDQTIELFGTREGIDRARAIIAEIDSPSGRLDVVYEPTRFPPDDVADLIREYIGGERGDGPDIVVNRLTGALLVRGTPAQHGRIEELLEDLLGSEPGLARRLRTFTLQNRDAAEVASVVQQILSQSESASDSARVPGAATSRESPRTADDPVGLAESGVPYLTSDVATNAVIAIGDPIELDRIESLIADLDVRRPQVQLEVLIVSLSDSDSLSLGVELQQLINDAGTMVQLSSLFGIAGLAPGTGSIGDIGGSGGTVAVLEPGNFSAVIQAIETINEGRSLSMPRVVVNDNESATINSVVQEPFTTLNASDTVATTSFGGSSDAGTQVTVTPQIAEGDYLVLEYDVSLSAFTGASTDPALPPPRQETSLASSATIPDGYTIALGGIEVVTDNEGETRVPLLGWIPLIGEAFKSRSQTSSRSRFFVFIRPTIMRENSFDALKYISDLTIEEYDVDDGWPEVAPRIIR
ncbi:MAG: secretin N-terminal domain-containing protein [Planctomycetota bacterium]